MLTLKMFKPFALPALAFTLLIGATPNSAKAEGSPFIGEIVPMSVSGFCPREYASAEGQLMSISTNQALFSLLGTIFGGDGRTTFALPDLRSRVPVGTGSGPGLSSIRFGQRTGWETTTLTNLNLPAHNHDVNATNADGDKPGPGGKILAAAPPEGTGTETIYSDQPATVAMSSNMISSTGLNQNFNHQDPTTVIRYCIALFGIYPSRS